MSSPVVDIIIPVHTTQRPVARAVGSVLRTTTTPTRANVVCHNISAAEIATTLGDWADDPRVRLLEHADAVPSPAGPLNAGLAASTAEFTALLGSDDEYEPGAIDAWVAVARRHDSHVVIPPLRTAPGGRTKSPPVRPFRTRALDGVRDRLAYRTVQLGLVSRERFGHVRMTEGLRTGEDVIQGASIWYSDARISLAVRAPGYLIHQDDDEGRTSTTPKPAAESFLFLDAVLDEAFTSTLSPAQRESFAIKLLRTSVMDVLAGSIANGALDADLTALRESTRRIVALAPSAPAVLSRREARIVENLSTTPDAATLTRERAALLDFRNLDNLLPASLSKTLHREAPLRYLAGYALIR